MKKSQFRRVFFALFLSLLLPGLGNTFLYRDSKSIKKLIISSALLVFIAIVVLLSFVIPEIGLALLASDYFYPAIVFIVLFWLLIFVIAFQDIYQREKQDFSFAKLFTSAVAFFLVGFSFSFFSLVTATTYLGGLSDVFGNGSNLSVYKNNYVILFAGLDRAPGRDILQADSINVAFINRTTKSFRVVSIPRTIQNHPYPEDSVIGRYNPEGNYCTKWCQINRSFVWGENNSGKYENDKDTGMQALSEAVSGLLGVPIDSYFAIDLDGFKGVINELGGVTVDVKKPVVKQGVASNFDAQPDVFGEPIPVGMQKLNGEDSLWFVRSRVYTGNKDRILRQQQFITSLFDQYSKAEVFESALKVVNKNPEYVQTNIDTSSMLSLAQSLANSQIEMQEIFEGKDDYRPDLEKINQDILDIVSKK